MKSPLTVGILGAGRIAAGFDSPDDIPVRTLAHAVKRTPQLALAGFFDRQPGRAAEVEAKWGCPRSPRDRLAWLAKGWDVICIATPDAAHAADLREVLARRPRAVLVEKPLATRDDEATELLRLARKLSVPLLVDFPRREHPAVRAVTRALRSGKLGEIRRITGLCSGGIRHNGVHQLDLVAEWFPRVDSVRKLGGGPTELLLELCAGSRRVPFWLTEATQPGCYVWELRIETERGRVELSGSPERLCVSRPGPHPNYPGFTALLPKRERPMETEPLLLHVLGRLAKLATCPAAARAQWELELERQRFFTKVFAHLGR
jgi:hypothetical protein